MVLALYFPSSHQLPSNKLEKCLGASSFEDRKECHTNAVVDKRTSASLGNRINCWQGGVSGMTHCFIQFMFKSVVAFVEHKTRMIAACVGRPVIESPF